ncbi:flagella basal body P-ring formation protein FlgA [Roseovarius nanhaiticus]|uniref:Flagella basal body P-ring formation protein FlgA n=1 Tax=Roseovarius nanhaiticus TaxID=573024 RepID=A0A1N7HKV5_9RHOB|nr:flagellar basal body P-ring formation chaperone FlgA [Roseovarius nanhaiticus]SEL26822.1 flagella basal body P-ring formation protein FlgA [Roseovarius nanhaiticus]SIS25515.1 flagella basal body P-ring formation protein FlgA [Roseovarius nanhaiticus]
MRYLAIAACLMAAPAAADTVLAARTIRAQTLISPQDLVVKDVDVIGAISDPALIAGQEARVALYAGRPIRPGDVGPPALVERNQIISLIYDQSGLSITAEGRSLSRAGPGETVRVMNLSSRITVSGQVMPDGRVLVSY